MNQQKTTRLRFTRYGRIYTIILDSVQYTKTLIINKIKIGYARYWFILQNNIWRVAGDMPLCGEFQKIIIQSLKVYHDLPDRNETIVSIKQKPQELDVLFNAVIRLSPINKLTT